MNPNHVHIAEHPVDGGEIYAETNLDAIVQEPWNAASAVVFVFIVLYWLFKLKGRFIRFPFLQYALPLLLVGGIGGTIYHAFRIHSFFIYMDWVPILLLLLSFAAYLIRLLMDSWWKAVVIVSAVFVTIFIVFLFVPDSFIKYAFNYAYFMTGMIALVPTLLVLKRSNYKNSHLIYIALGAFLTALTCRAIDLNGVLPMGTHFLWHVFGAFACHISILYIYRMQPVRLVVWTRQLEQEKQSKKKIRVG